MTAFIKSPWLRLTLLLLFCVVPVAAGIVRLTEIFGHAAVTPANHRFLDTPLPAVIHIVSVIVFAVVGSFQFFPALRKGPKSWHRKAGLVLLPTGFVVALSGLWLTLTYPWPAGDGIALYWTRLVVGIWMTLALAMSLRHLLSYRFQRHGQWMLRAYAVGMGAATQVFTHIPWFIVHGAEVPPESLRALMMGLGWAINIAFAEWYIWRSSPKHTQISHSND